MAGQGEQGGASDAGAGAGTSIDRERPLVELARPKVNLTLRVLGRRADGYHELESLVAFADGVADTLTLEPGGDPEVVVGGPFGVAISGANLVTTALERLAAAEPRLRLGRVRLEKHLPVAAGIGGGSADAAALIRAVRRANPGLADAVDWFGLARGLGADVPVCLLNRAALMRGTGERLEPLKALAPLPAVLINPMAPVPPDKTAQVFRLLEAPLLQKPTVAAAQASDAEDGPPSSGRELVLYINRHGNDLAGPAIAVVQQVASALAALERDHGALLARLSGAGPTAFGVFDTWKMAERAREAIKARHPAWWVEAVVLG
jgi:4-diphosphocytidyl-2-C-methyl-D-erythritol kinase